MDKIKVIAIIGPTATGKTALSVRLARRYAGEIVSADSMQIYRGLGVGTAKPTESERGGIPHHMLDIADISDEFSVADYVGRAHEAVAGIHARGGLPIIVGGTGLYVRSLLEDLSFSPAPKDLELRESLDARWLSEGGEALHCELARLDPEAAGRIHPGDRKRLVRALEVCGATGVAQSEWARRSKPVSGRYDAALVGLRCADRAELYRRIDARVDAMLERGLLDEARMLYGVRAAAGTAAQSIGYKELFAFFDGECTLGQAVENIKRATRRYAKRQLTWFSRDRNVVWLDIDTQSEEEIMEKLCKTVEIHLEK